MEYGTSQPATDQSGDGEWRAETDAQTARPTKSATAAQGVADA